MQRIVPIILAGGVGTRLWPVSRESYPKQFRKIGDTPSLFQQTLNRFRGPQFARPIIVTNEDYRFHVVEQMGELGCLPELILLEPFSRNTGPAVLAATLAQAAKDPETVCLIAPADHDLPDTDAFVKSVEAWLSAVDDGQLVTFGIVPNRVETAYGYLELTEPAVDFGSAQSLRSFTEKPKQEDANRMTQDGRFLWNAGIFLFRCRDMLASFKLHAPEMIAPAQNALSARELDLGFSRLPAEHWGDLPDLSIDYAIMEHADNLSVVPFNGFWSDLGGWQSMWRNRLAKDEDTDDGVARSGPAHAFDCENSLLLAENEGQILVGLGLENIIAVATRDAVLVADKNMSGQVGAVVKALKAKGVSQATKQTRDYRPWGWFETLVTVHGFQVKLITVHPRGVLSLQSHEQRSEHWVVVEGQATVTIGDSTFNLLANQSTYVPKGTVHRLENEGTTDVVLIEVQTGPYLGEDDIIRYEDAYARD